jgi:hypothetical protein
MKEPRKAECPPPVAYLIRWQRELSVLSSHVESPKLPILLVSGSRNWQNTSTWRSLWNRYLTRSIRAYRQKLRVYKECALRSLCTACVLLLRLRGISRSSANLRRARDFIKNRSRDCSPVERFTPFRPRWLPARSCWSWLGSREISCSMDPVETR